MYYFEFNTHIKKELSSSQQIDTCSIIEIIQILSLLISIYYKSKTVVEWSTTTLDLLGLDPQLVCIFFFWGLAHNRRSQENFGRWIVVKYSWEVFFFFFWKTNCPRRISDSRGALQVFQVESPFPNNDWWFLSFLSCLSSSNVPTLNPDPPLHFYTLLLVYLSWWKNILYVCESLHLWGLGGFLDLGYCSSVSNLILRSETHNSTVEIIF